MALNRHRDWSTSTFDLPPVAPAVGPFPRREFLRAVSIALGDRDVVLLDSGRALLPLHEVGGRLTLAGDPDLADYRSPLGDGVVDLVADFAAELAPGTEIDFDSLPEEAAAPLAEGMEKAGLRPVVEQHTLTAVIPLPPTFGEYLEAIGKKQRHELRRKRRRYEHEVGPLAHETHRGAGWAFGEFVRLHHSAPGEKGTFLTEEREELFRQLAESEGWRIDLLRLPGTDRASAALFSFAGDDGLYLYNSAYDPTLSAGSPGVAMLGSMIERAIEEGFPRFDFLKGDEVYKFRLGAQERPLHRLRLRT